MSSSSGVAPFARVAWRVLVLLLALEAALLIWVAVLAVAATAQANGLLVQNISLVLVTVCALTWVVLTLTGAARSRAGWARGSAVTIHVLLFSAGTGCLQLAIGPWQLGVALVLVALVGFASALVARTEPQAIPE